MGRQGSEEGCWVQLCKLCGLYLLPPYSRVNKEGGPLPLTLLEGRLAGGDPQVPLTYLLGFLLPFAVAPWKGLNPDAWT